MMKLNYSIFWLVFSLTNGSFVPNFLQGQSMDMAGPTIAELYDHLPFDMAKVSEPIIPAPQVNIVDYGAVGDGMTLNTRAIAQAIKAVTNLGGGTVIIPRGIWLTGPIVLQSNLRIHTEEGALVLFSRNKELYPLVETSFEGLETYRCQSPISGKALNNIAFTGQGIFDGSGEAWRPVKKSKMTPPQWNKLIASGGVLSEDERIWYPSEQYKMGDSPGNFNVPNLNRKEQFQQIKDFLRPVMVSLVNCKKVLLDGPTFQNSPAWNIHPLMCEEVIIRNLTIRNPWYSQNGDGLDLESCQNALIYNNTFDVGDDAICIKSGKNEDGRRRGRPTQNVIVSHNIVYHGHGGFVVGSEMSGGVRNIKVSHCTFIGTDVGLRFKSTRGRGGIVENIYISDIDMVNIPTEAIRFNLFYGGNAPILEEDQSSETEIRDETVVPVTEETPSFRNIYLRDISVTQSNTAAKFQGLPEMNLLNVTLQDAFFDTVHGMTVIDGDGIKLRNIRLNQQKGAGLTVYNSKNVEVREFDFQQNEESWIRILGTLSNQIKLDIPDIEDSNIVFGLGAKKNSVQF